MSIKNILGILACPVCNGKLLFEKTRLICIRDKLAYSIKDNIPCMVPSAAKTLDFNEVEILRKKYTKHLKSNY